MLRSISGIGPETRRERHDMSKRMVLVAASVLAALAFAALPAAASAAPSVDFSVENPTFSGTFGEATLTAVGQEEIVCTSENHVNGSWETTNKVGTTGHISLTFTHCHPKETPGIACTTSGQASGVITTGSSLFHLVYITSDINTPSTMLTKVPGLLVTPPSGGTFAEFNCSFLVHLKIAGTGIIGKVTAPTCGSAASGSSTVQFTSASTGKQTYQLAEGNATTYHLTSSLNSGSAVEASEDVESTTTLAGGATGQLTCN